MVSGGRKMKELEVKILNIDLEEMENKLKSIGAQLIENEVQTNTLIDKEDNYIEENLDAYMRIRETKSYLTEKTKTILTFKKNIVREGIRENIETNVNIDNKEGMIEILNSLGFVIKQVGYKERISYKLDSIRFDLDTWDKETYPYPYMEIEVEKEEDLEKMISLLEIPKENISIKSILELRRELGQQ